MLSAEAQEDPNERENSRSPDDKSKEDAIVDELKKLEVTIAASDVDAAKALARSL